MGFLLAINKSKGAFPWISLGVLPLSLLYKKYVVNVKDSNSQTTTFQQSPSSKHLIFIKSYLLMKTMVSQWQICLKKLFR